MFLRIVKVVTATMSLFILMPAGKVALPSGLILMAALFTVTWFMPIALIIAAGNLYLIASAANTYDSKRDDLISISFIALVFVVLYFRVDKIFMSEAPFICVFSWLSFIIPALCTAVLSCIRLRGRDR
jgi:hypothetical protein